MGYSIGKTPAIDEIVIKTLVIPVISPKINPLDVLEAVREAIEQVLDNDLDPDKKSEVCQYYESLPPAQLKAALKVVNRRIAYANALDEYLEVLYHESVGNDSELTPHTQVESTPRFNFDAIDEHLKFYLLQGTDSDVSDGGLPAPRIKSKNTIEKSIESANYTSFLIADTFLKSAPYKKPNGELNINAISTAVMIHARGKYKDLEGQSDSSVRDRLKAGILGDSISEL